MTPAARHLRFPVLLAALALLAACAADAAVAGQTLQPVPEDGVITLTDPDTRDWGPGVVHYRLDTERFPPDGIVVLDPAGRRIPHQVEGDRLAFVAALPRGGTAVYRVAARRPDDQRWRSPLKVQSSDALITVRNEHLALQMPAAGEETFEAPRPAAKVRPPLLRWRQEGFDWIGGMRFATERKLTGVSYRILRRGDAVFEYEARYRFAGGEYVWTLQMAAGLPLARITEESDFGELKRLNEDFLLLELHKGWRPPVLAYATGSGETGAKSQFADYAEHVVGLSAAGQEARPQVGAVGKPPQRTVPREGLRYLSSVVPAGKWGGYKGGVGVRSHRPAAAGAAPAGPVQHVGLVPLHVGSWRRAMALDVWADEEAGVVVELPLDARWMWWHLDAADERSPFSTHEHDRRFRPSYLRREWGLYVGPELHEAQMRYGFIGLDAFKEWTLDWPDRAGAGAYPRAFFTPAIVAEMKRQLEDHPDRGVLAGYYLVSGDPADARASAERFVRGMKRMRRNLGFSGLSHYRQAGQLKALHYAEDALACPELPAPLRRELRRGLAVAAYCLSHPDFNPRGAGVHLGNNNMTINRTTALAYCAPLLPDHPRYEAWLARLDAYVRFKLASQTAVDGVWVACPNYQLYGPTRFLDAAVNILRNSGWNDLVDEAYHGRVLRYTANLTMPDLRFGGLRIIPGMGNSANRLTSIFGLGMRAGAGPDRDAAAWLHGMHRDAFGAGGVGRAPGNAGFNAFNFRPQFGPAEVTLQTEFLPTYGVMFRHHANTEHETAMLFRAPMNWSHWNPDYLNLILYSRSVPLSPGTQYGYYHGPAKHDNAIHYNQVKLVAHDKREIFGRVDSTVRAWGFGPEVDYAMADRFYPPEHFDDNTERHWRRHVAFLKSPDPAGPSYFVLRETFPGNPQTDQTWWTWLNLGGAERIRVEGRPFAAEETPVDAVPDLQALPLQRGQTLQMESIEGGSTWFWFDRPLDCRARITFTARHPLSKKHLPDLGPAYDEYLPDGVETKTIVETMADPGEDYFYVLFPRTGGLEAPAAAAPAEGCLRVQTAESLDYVFVSDEPLALEVDEVTFAGRAGAVRIRDDRVVLSLTAGPGRVGYRGHVLEGTGPFERSIPLADLREGVRPVREKNPAGAWQETEIAEGVTVSGEGPFEASFDGEVIRLTTTGRKRVLHITKPKNIRRPQYYVDGQEWMACWTDWPASGAGTWARTKLIGITVPAGRHRLEIRDLVFPPVWEPRFTPRIEGVRQEP